MRRSGVTIASLILIALCGLLLAIVMIDRPGASTSETADAGDGGSKDRRPPLVGGIEDASIAKTLDPAVESRLPGTKLPIRLLGTVMATVDAEAPPLSLAVIEEEATRARQVVRVGDSLASHHRVRVSSIASKHVILQNGTRQEALWLESGGVRRAPISDDEMAALVEQVAGVRDPSEPEKARDPSPDDLLAEDLAALAFDDGGIRSGPALLAQGRFSPEYDERLDQILGMQIYDIEPGGFYDRIGLADGDVITAVNGIEVQTITAANEMLLEFSQAGALEIELRTSDQRITVTPDQMNALLNP